MSSYQHQCNGRRGRHGRSNFPIGLSPGRQLLGVAALLAIWAFTSADRVPNSPGVSETQPTPRYTADIIEDIIDVIEEILGGGG